MQKSRSLTILGWYFPNNINCIIRGFKIDKRWTIYSSSKWSMGSVFPIQGHFRDESVRSSYPLSLFFSPPLPKLQRAQYPELTEVTTILMILLIKKDLLLTTLSFNLLVKMIILVTINWERQTVIFY